MKSESSFEVNGVAVKDLKEHGVVDESSLEVPSKSKNKTSSDSSSEGNVVAIKDSKHHDVVGKDSLEAPTRSEKKTNFDSSPKKMME